MSTALHLCTPDDAARLGDLMTRFAQEYGLDQTPEDRAAALAPLLDGHPYGMAYLLGPSRASVGYLIVTLGWSIELGGMEAWLDEIYIRPPVRGRGIATEVLHALSKTLKQAGVRALHLEVDREAEATQRLYRRAGFALRDRHCLITRGL